MAHRLASLDYRVGSDISERHKEGCTPIRCRLRPDPAFVTRDDALDRGKPDSGALEFGFGMKALKGGEKLLGMRHVESRAVVANEESLVGSPPWTDFDARVGSLRCELPRVAKKVFEYRAGKSDCVSPVERVKRSGRRSQLQPALPFLERLILSDRPLERPDKSQLQEIS